MNAMMRLQVGLVGEHARYDPNLSAFGLASRLAFINGFSAGEYFSGLGLRVRRDEDLSRVLTHSEARKQALANTLSITRPATWDLGVWLPFEMRHARLEEAWEFRYCPSCLRTGFHSLFFQLPWIHRCPWHGQRVRGTCIRCERSMVVSGAHGKALLQCECGHEAIDAMGTLTPSPALDTRRTRFLAEYRAWAAVERSQATVIAPASGRGDWRRLSHSVRLPAHLSDPCQDLIAEPTPVDTERVLRVAPGWLDKAVLDALSELRKDDPGVMELPACMARSFDMAARQMALALPRGSLTDREMALFFPGLGSAFKPARRKSSMDLGYVPPQHIGSRNYLHLHTIPPTVLRTAWYVMQEAVGDGLAGNVPGNRQIAAVAAVTVGRLLTRGYVEGMRSILARHVPVVLAHPRLRPRFCEPWVWMRRDLAGLRCAVHWSAESLRD